MCYSRPQDKPLLQIQSSKGNRLTLRLQKKTGHIHVLVPHGMQRTVVDAFVADKTDWINKAYQNWKKRKALHLLSNSHQLPKQFFLWGESHQINWLPYAFGARHHLLNKTLVLFVKGHQSKKKLFEKYLEQQLLQQIFLWNKKWGAVIGKSPKKIELTTNVSYWGVCQPNREKIILNLHLIHYPIDCVEAVWVHEMVHLLEPSHNQRFHRLMKQFLPDYKAREQRLRSFPLQINK